MKSIISCTSDEKYSYFIPIVTWAWNKLDVGVVLFLPESSKGDEKVQLGLNCMNYGYKENQNYYFDMPKHKEATAAQCVRLYGACLDLPEDEVLITSDVDMAVFKLPVYIDDYSNSPTIFGADLTPANQLPICYASAKVSYWRKAFDLTGVSYQKALDNLLGGIECENMRGNYWGKDQEELYNKTWEDACLINRARPGTQFAGNRVDRDDVNWRAYVNDDLVDAHLWRNGYTDENFANILELLTAKYPNDNFDWLISYNNAYKQLL